MFLQQGGVTAVEPLGDGVFRLHHRPGAPARERIAELAVERRWGLLELVPETSTLEETFLRATRDEGQAA